MKFILTCCILAMLSSCGTSIGNKQKEEDLDQIRIGMSRNEVVDLLGKPESYQRDASQNIVYNYTYWKIRHSVRNYIPIVNLFGTNMKTENQNFTVYFDRNGKVKNFGQFGSSGDPNAQFRDTAPNPAVDSYPRTRPATSLSKKDAKRELLDKYLKREITKQEYLEFTRKIDSAYD